MTTRADSLISTVDHVANKLGPITLLVDVVMDRLAPKSTAQAACYIWYLCQATYCQADSSCPQGYRDIYTYAKYWQWCGTSFQDTCSDCVNCA